MSSPVIRLNVRIGAALLAAVALPCAGSGCRAPLAARTGHAAPCEATGQASTKELRALAAYQAGLETELAGDAEAALECFAAAVELAPRVDGYRSRLGLALAAAGRDAEAVGELERAVELGGASPELHQALAEIHLRGNRRAEAARQFELVLDCPEISAPGRWADAVVMRMASFLAAHYAREGRPVDAARMAARLAGRFPDRPEFRLESARHLLAAGYTARALEELEHFESRLPLSSAGARLLALHHHDRGENAAALGQTERALTLVGSDPSAPAGEVARLRHLRADLLGRLGRHDEAGRELIGLLAAAADDGERVETLVALAYLDCARSRPAEAVARMQGALLGGLNSPRLWAAMATALSRDGRPGEAVAAWRSALRLCPGDAGYQLELAVQLERLGRRAEAAAELRAALSSSPDDADCAGLLGYLYALEGISLDEAQKLTADAVRLRPESGRLLHYRGWALYRLGRIEEARRALETAALREPTAEVHVHLGDALYALGLWRRARRAWHRALELDAGSEAARRRLGRFGEAAP
jgi:tetratricopeptide (TPR) repeat protein